MSKTSVDNSNIIETNNDACQCKLYAVERGYWKDPYIKLFVGGGQHERRTPEISLGYYVRVHGLRQLIEQFIRRTDQQCQIINLGCGFDTTVFNLLDNEQLQFKHFVDVDFDEITEIKSTKVRRLPLLQKKLPEDTQSLRIPCGFHSSRYTILPADLRDVSQLDSQLKLLFDNHVLDCTKPTLFISECVLVYMSGEHSSSLLTYLGQTFSRCCLFVNFEQINMSDRFGQIMCENLKQRSCHLVGMEACQAKTSQCQRFLNASFNAAQCVTLNEFYRKYLNAREKQRIELIDGGLDEKELLEQLFEHYCFSWAYRDDENIGLSSIAFE